MYAPVSQCLVSGFKCFCLTFNVSVFIVQRFKSLVSSINLSSVQCLVVLCLYYLLLLVVQCLVVKCLGVTCQEVQFLVVKCLVSQCLVIYFLFVKGLVVQFIVIKCLVFLKSIGFVSSGQLSSFSYVVLVSSICAVQLSLCSVKYLIFLSSV